MEEVTAASNMKTATQNIKEHEKSNMMSWRDHSPLPVIEFKDMEKYNLLNKEFKIGVLRKLNELPKNTEK